MNLLAQQLTKNGATVLPKGKVKPFKYETVTKQLDILKITQIEIWNKCVDAKNPLVCVCVDEDGKETYSRINGNYYFVATSEEIFGHYKELERLLIDAKRQIKHLGGKNVSQMGRVAD